MSEIREVLYQKTKRVSNKKIASNLGISRTSVCKYIKIAQSFGFNELVSNTILEEITNKVYQRIYYSRTKESECFTKLNEFQKQIGLWLEEKYITHTQINRKLKEKGISIRGCLQSPPFFRF